MKSATRKILKILISIVYIVWGIYSPLSVIKAVFALDVGALISAFVGVLTLLAGIFGLIGIKKMKCRIFGIIIMIFSIVSIVYTLPMGVIPTNSIINAILAWLFISCV
jgi:hypothetical protein